MNSSLAIVIPTINRADLLVESIEALRLQSDQYRKLVIIDNGGQALRIDLPRSEVVNSNSNLGVAASWNLGINMVIEDHAVRYILVINDDIVLSNDQLEKINKYLEKNSGIWLFVGPFFWSVWIISREGLKAIRELDSYIFDERFFPAYFEDNDFLYRFKNRFPDRIQEGLRLLEPLVKRNACSQSKEPKLKNTRINKLYYQTKWGGPPGHEIRHPDEPLTILFGYETHCKLKSDINEHLPTLAMLSKQCKHVTEFGSGRGYSTWGILFGLPEMIVAYDILKYHTINLIEDVANCENVKFEFIQCDVLDADIAATDMLFIDTLHTYVQLNNELQRHASKVAKFMVFHDTVSFGHKDELGGGEILVFRGLIPAILNFLATSEGKNWRHFRTDPNNNGLTILERMSLTC